MGTRYVELTLFVFDMSCFQVGVTALEDLQFVELADLRDAGLSHELAVAVADAAKKSDGSAEAAPVTAQKKATPTQSTSHLPRSPVQRWWDDQKFPPEYFAKFTMVCAQDRMLYTVAQCVVSPNTDTGTSVSHHHVEY